MAAKQRERADGAVAECRRIARLSHREVQKGALVNAESREFYTAVQDLRTCLRQLGLSVLHV